MITHLKYNEIDFEKWDNCIEKSYNSLVYAKSWYLDIVSSEWEALIFGDYEYVMPLPVKRKYGISYLVQPILTQQLGVFSAKEIDEKTIERFIQKIPYRHFFLHINEENYSEKATKLPNYILDLQPDYNNLRQLFSQNTKRNIAKAIKSNIVIKDNLSSKNFLDFYFSLGKKYLELNRNIVSKLINSGFERKEMSLYGAYNFEDKLVAAFCLLYSKNRLIYLLPVSNEEGKKTSAMFAIVNEIIKTQAGKNRMLDFEGSQVDSIARFYRSFGAQQLPYFTIKKGYFKLLSLLTKIKSNF